MTKAWIVKNIGERYFLLVGKKVFSCQLGDNGTKPASKKIEGDKATPNGKFKLSSIYFRKDKVLRSHTKKSYSLKLNQITTKCGWCNDIKSSRYNKYIDTNKVTFKNTTYENLWREDDVYDIIILISYNIKPTIKKKGSAIFIHCSFFDNRNTAGCVAMKKKDLVFLLRNYKNGTYLKI